MAAVERKEGRPRCGGPGQKADESRRTTTIKTTTTTTTIVRMMMSSFFKRKVAAAVAVVVLSIGVASTQAVAAQDKNATAACEAMAEKLNQRYLVGSNRFNTTETGQEARDDLREWMNSNGILLSMCNPQGYPDVYGPCTDEYPMDHIAATWVGLTDRAKELVEADTFSPFPVFAAGVGVVFDPTFEQVQVHCSSPTDSTSAGRQPNEDGPGCGPMTNNMLYGKDSKFADVQAYLAGDANATVEFAAADALKQYYKMVSKWDQMNWKQGEDFAEAPFNVTCKQIVEDSLGLDPWPAVTPAENTMEACRAFISDPKNLNKGKFGPFQVLGSAGTWDINSTLIQDALGHEFCIDDEDDPCIEEGSCPGKPLEWVGVCTWKPEDFMTSIDFQHELGSMKPARVDGPSAFLWNEISVPLEANTPQGVEAVFHFGSYFDTFIANSLSQSPSETADPLPADYAEYAKYAAQKLAEGYYGGVPVVTVTPTKENALAGKIFGCSP